MCDPVSIGLTLAGGALQGISQGQIASAQKRDIGKAGQSYEAERGRQAGYRDQNYATVGDTLANFSLDNQNKLQSDATAKRTAAYVNPLHGMTFGAAPVANADANYAVDSRNARTADAARSKAIGEATAKANLDGYGDMQTGNNIYVANNANKIDQIDRIAAGSQAAEGVQQGALQSKLAADKSAGSFVGGLGDLFSAAGSIYGMGAGGGFGGLKTGIQQFGARNGIGFLADGMKYISPFAGAPGSGVYQLALPAIS